MAEQKVKATDLQIGNKIRFTVEGHKEEGTITVAKPSKYDPEGSLRLIVETIDGGIMQREYKLEDEVTLIG
jgi:hypothetical protein